ncbi:MAG: hypothetical protein ACLFQX_00010 [Candidatus Kapaibacterium sp.]
MSLYTALVWLLIAFGSQASKADSIEARLEVHDSPDVCGSLSQKRVLVTIDIGTVLPTDSLFGFDFSLYYNPDKFKFTDGIYINTLAEFFEMKDITFDEGVISGYVIQFNPHLPPVYGDRALIGFLGYYLNDCPDTTIMHIRYLEFTEEYQHNVANYVPDTIHAVVREKDDRTLAVNFDKNSIEFISDSTIGVTIAAKEYDDSRLNSFYVNIGGRNTESFEYYVNELSDNIRVESITEENSLMRLECGIEGSIDGEEILELMIKRKENVDVEFEIVMVPDDLNECACITNLDGDTLLISSEKKEDTTSVVQTDRNIKYYYDKKFDEFVIETPENSEILIYGFAGALKMKKRKSEIYNRIDASEWPQGIYPAMIKTRNDINKILLIKY